MNMKDPLIKYEILKEVFEYMDNHYNIAEGIISHSIFNGRFDKNNMLCTLSLVQKYYKNRTLKDFNYELNKKYLEISFKIIFKYNYLDAFKILFDIFKSVLTRDFFIEKKHDMIIVGIHYTGSLYDFIKNRDIEKEIIDSGILKNY